MVLYCIGSRTERLFVITYIRNRTTQNKQYINNPLKIPSVFYCKKTIYTRAHISVGLTWNYSVFICTRLHISSYLSRSCCGMFSLFIPLQLLCFLWLLKIYKFFRIFFSSFVILLLLLYLIMNRYRDKMGYAGWWWWIKEHNANISLINAKTLNLWVLHIFLFYFHTTVVYFNFFRIIVLFV